MAPLPCPPQPDASRRRWTALGLLAATAIVIALGALWRGAEEPAAEPPPVPERPEATWTETSEQAGALPLPPPAPEVLPAPGEDTGPAASLEARVRSDPQRLAAGGFAFTNQLMVACQAGNVERLLSQVGDARLYVLPALYEGRTCYRVCWGGYPDRASAAAGRDMPGPIRALFPDPQPRPVSAVLP